MESLDLRPLARDVSRGPAPLRLLWGSLFFGLIWNALPWGETALALRPDLLLLVLLFWALQEPQRMGQGIAFSLGLAMDVSRATLLGEHALAYVAAVYLLQNLRVRVLKFQGLQQATYIFGALLLASLLEATLQLLIGGGLPGLWFWVAPAAAAVLWLPLTMVMFHPRLRFRRGVRGL